jgi:alkyl hydroperoxide reductase subunit AhpC
MRIILRLEFVDGKSKEVTASAADLVAFEREFDISVTSLSGDTKFTHLLWLAWHSEKRRKETAQEFDVWVESVEMVGGSDTDPK